MTANPIDIAIADGSPVSKAAIRSYENARVRMRVADATEVRNTDFTAQYGGLRVAALTTDFDLDVSDTTTADDGINCIVDFAGNRFKPVSAMVVPTTVSLGGVFASTAVSHQFVTGLNTSGALTRAQPALSDLSDNITGKDTDGTFAANSDTVVPTQKAVKTYVDTVAQGLDAKQAALVATTANITLSGEQTIDGTLTSASRVLVKNQSTASQNGIYVSAAGAWARATDADTWAELPSAFVFVEKGTINGDCGFVCTVDAGGTIGSTSVTFTQFSGAGAYTAGTGLTQTGTQFAIDPVTATAALNLADASLKGLAPAFPNDATKYLDGTGLYSTPAGSGGGLVDEVRRNIILAGIRTAKALGAVQPLVNGVTDGFGGTDGVNAGASSNYSVDTTNRRVINSVTTPGETMISAGAGTTQADQFTTRTSASFDGNTAQAVGVCTDGPNLVNIGRLGKDFGAGNAKVITGMTAYSSTDGGFLNSLTTCNLVLKASNTDPTTTSWTGTTIGTIAGFTNANSAFTKSTLGNANTTAYRYAWLEMSGTNSRWLSELQFFETVPPTINNMTVVETGYADLDFVPSTIRVSAVIEPVDAATLNTDATFEVSRDNGATWSAASMTQYHTLGTKVFVESAAITVTGQPSGTKPCFRYKTFNNKRVYLHGVTLSAAA